MRKVQWSKAHGDAQHKESGVIRLRKRLDQRCQPE